MVNHVGSFFNFNKLIENLMNLDNICTDIMIPGLAFTIEPIVLMNKPQNYFLWKDSFTIIPIPKIPSAQWEHTIIITENGHEVITKRSNENFE